MNKQWMKWMINLSSVAVFTSMIGYLNHSDTQRNNADQTDSIAEEAADMLDWSEKQYDDPMSTSTFFIQLDETPIVWDDTDMISDQQPWMQQSEVRQSNGPRRTRSRPS